MKRNESYRFPWTVIGFAIGVSISLFVRFGINLLLSLVKNLNLPEHEVVLYTSLFYGAIFFIAWFGLRADRRSNQALISRWPRLIEDDPPPKSKINSMISRVKTILWSAFGIFSVVWITPALILYWVAPKHPERGILACTILFSLAGATAFFLKNSHKIQTAVSRLMFFIGVCFGTFFLVHFFPGI